jgi:hypothetical protein
MTNDEIELGGGFVNTVTRKGDVVYRTGGPWVPAMHQVLDHLRRNGFQMAPAPLGVDQAGREMISFLPGETMPRPWQPVMFTDAALEQAAAMIRGIHDATRDLELPPETVWRTGPCAKTPGQVIRHGDLGPWNTLWTGTHLTGLIDWDFAEPGHPISDVAQVALHWIPLRGEAHARECGFDAAAADLPRLETLCAACGGFDPKLVVREVERLQRLDIFRIHDFGTRGIYPWTKLRDRQVDERIRHELDWLREMFPDAFNSWDARRNSDEPRWTPLATTPPARAGGSPCTGRFEQ